MGYKHLMTAALKTEGDFYDTGIRLRGFEVHARPPHHYRHHTTIFLVHPQIFETEVYPVEPMLGSPRWAVGFIRPDGIRQDTYCTYPSADAAEHARLTYHGATAAQLIYQFEIGYKTPTGEWATKETGRPWGTVWGSESAYSLMIFDLTEEEAAIVLVFREEIDTEWVQQSADYLREEKEHTTAVAHAAALDWLPAAVLNTIAGPTECLECGATFDSPGSVRSHQMGCDRCA